MRVLSQLNNECFVACGDRVIALDYSKSENSVREFVYSKSEGHFIITLSVSDGYVFAGYSNKHVCCWDVVTGELLGSGVFKKRPTAVVYSSFERNGTTYKAILVSDKTGDVWGADVPLLKNQTIIAGHTASIITDMTIDNNLVVTADRDEKIRVSRFPDLETIVSYCFYHTSVVSSVNFIQAGNNSLLLSSSWDHRLCLWNPSTGTLLATHQYPVDSSTVTAGVPSSSSEVADAVVDEAGEIVNEESAAVEVGDDDIELVEKTYDETSAGHYPCKVATTSINGVAVAAVEFKNSTSLSLHRIAYLNNSDHDVEIGDGTTLELSVIPSDIIFIDSDKLIVLLPAPHIMRAYQISTEANSIHCVDISSQYKCVNEFQTKINEAGLTFSQFVDHIDAEASEEKGMKKHTLDKPFDKDVNINYTAKRGSKRSRKN